MNLNVNRQRGFTLVEILVVIAIIAVLAGILFPLFAQAKESALESKALNQIKQLGAALNMYASQNDEKELASTNYGYPDSAPDKMWQNDLVGLVKDHNIFVAPGSEGKFAETFDERGEMSVGYTSATAVDTVNGCPSTQTDTDACIAFTTVTSFPSNENQSAIGLLAVTPNGPTTGNYRGYEFSPYNGAPDTEHPKLSPPLVSDRDLVKEMTNLGPDALKPIYCRYLSNLQDAGFTPVVFADTHAKNYSAKQIQDSSSNIVWRFR